MNNSQLIVFTFKEALYCCCFVYDSLMACSSNKALTFWDFAQGKMISQYRFPSQVSPISITTIGVTKGKVTLLLQLKQSMALIFTLDQQSKNIIKVHEYQLEMIGFTKLSIASYNYDSQGNVEKMIGSHFFTIRYSNTIEKRNILTGKIEQQIEIDQTKFEEVSCLLTYAINNTTYFMVVEEGTAFKQFIIDSQSQLIEANKIISIVSKSEISIALSVEPISEYRAYVCMRNDYIYIINLKELQVQQHLDINSFRIIKSMPYSKQQNLYALSSKNEISILKDNKIKQREKIQKSFIMDIDTFQFGIIGVSEEGKILFLPLL